MRLFVAIDLPAEAKDSLGELIERLRSSIPDAKWVPRDNLHLTLSFLGEVPDERADAVRHALRDAAAALRGPIPTRLSGIGAFPTARRARVLWAGLDDTTGGLAAIAGMASSAMEPLGFVPERRAWTPHLTLARLRVPGSVLSVVDAPVAQVAFEVPDVVLFRSRLRRPAPDYEPLERFRLGR
jgi:2'-5' RNA ligase